MESKIVPAKDLVAIVCTFCGLQTSFDLVLQTIQVRTGELTVHTWFNLIWKECSLCSPRQLCNVDQSRVRERFTFEAHAGSTLKSECSYIFRLSEVIHSIFECLPASRPTSH